MGRVITPEKKALIISMSESDPTAVGPVLGKLLIDGNVPIEAAAALLNVSEPTIYRWMYGHSVPRDLDKIAKIKALLMVLRKAKRAKELPLTGAMKDRIAKTGELALTYRPIVRAG